MSGYFTCSSCKDPNKLDPADGPYEGVCETCYDVYLDWLYEDLETSTEIRGVKQWLDQRNELKPGSPGGAESRDCSA
jgi:hypothetical protein